MKLIQDMEEEEEGGTRMNSSWAIRSPVSAPPSSCMFPHPLLLSSSNSNLNNPHPYTTNLLNSPTLFLSSFSHPFHNTTNRIGSIMLSMNLGSNPVWRFFEWQTTLTDGLGYSIFIVGILYIILGLGPWNLRKFRDDDLS